MQNIYYFDRIIIVVSFRTIEYMYCFSKSSSLSISIKDLHELPNNNNNNVLLSLIT